MDTNFTNAMRLITVIVNGVVFFTSLVTFSYVAFVKRRTELFLVLSPFCFAVIGFVLFFIILASIVNTKRKDNGLWFT